MRPQSLLVVACAFLFAVSGARAADTAPILTPPAPAAPRINGASVFGVRPQSPFLYTIPATGERPLAFAAENLPEGLAVDAKDGRITGTIAQPGTYEVVLIARNARGEARRRWRVVCGETIALTPPMGWNSWNCWAEAVDAEKVMRSARAMVTSGLAQHGWTYINIDDTWQGERTGAEHALQANSKFGDLGKLCDDLHALGLKAGIYSTPWITSYAKFPGGSSDATDGAWSKTMADTAHWRHGRYSFAAADARQWAAWGFDYLKYDWKPNDVRSIAEMSDALRRGGRDIIFSLSNSAPFENVAEIARLANSWRTTADIFDHWVMAGEFWQYGVSEIGFSQDRWVPYACPGHWNDPDMLVVGRVGWGNPHPSGLTPDEQYSHLSLWCMLSAPLLIGCDLETIDPFTLNLLTNDEVLALDQDALGREATRVAISGPVDIYLKDLEDGSKALGFFNRDSAPHEVVFNKLSFLGFTGRHHVRDLWRQVDLPDMGDPVKEPLRVNIAPHGVMLYKLSAAP